MILSSLLFKLSLVTITQLSSRNSPVINTFKRSRSYNGKDPRIRRHRNQGYLLIYYTLMFLHCHLSLWFAERIAGASSKKKYFYEAFLVMKTPNLTAAWSSIDFSAISLLQKVDVACAYLAWLRVVRSIKILCPTRAERTSSFRKRKYLTWAERSRP